MKRTLYLGIDPPTPLSSKYYYKENETKIIHFPIIKIIPQQKSDCVETFHEFSNYTHLIFTSKSSIKIFFEMISFFSIDQELIKKVQIIVVGKSTAKTLNSFGINTNLIAQNETAEGIIELLETLHLKNSFIFWPHSNLSRTNLISYFLKKKIRFKECVLYKTVPNIPKIIPNLSEIDEIVFTSPSTVDAFLKAYKTLPLDKILTPIGPITQIKIEKSLA